MDGAWAAGFTAIAVAALVGAELRGARAVRIVAKGSASAGFLLAGALAGLPWGGPAERAVFVGLGLGAIGDLCLLSREKRPFLAGIVAFLLNHVAYVAAFAWLGVSVGGALVALVPLGVAAAVVWRWAGARAGSLRGAVLAYIAVISAMVAVAVGAAVLGGPGRGALLVGALLFYVSDLAVARDRFVAPGPANKAVGLPLYYAAQLVFALSTPAGG